MSDTSNDRGMKEVCWRFSMIRLTIDGAIILFPKIRSAFQGYKKSRRSPSDEIITDEIASHSGMAGRDPFSPSDIRPGRHAPFRGRRRRVQA
jgi:hypothetical protein